MDTKALYESGESVSMRTRASVTHWTVHAVSAGEQLTCAIISYNSRTGVAITAPTWLGCAMDVMRLFIRGLRGEGSWGCGEVVCITGLRGEG